MKLLKVIIALSCILFLTNCTEGVVTLDRPNSEIEGSSLEMPKPIAMHADGPDAKYSMPHYGWRLTQFLGFGFKLNKEEKKKHESAVFFMLDNARDGVIVSWYSKDKKANGKVRALHSYPTGSGLCRTYQAYIRVGGTERHMTNNACKKNYSISWSFYK